MGASLSWLAVRGKSPQAVRRELGLRSSGKRESYPSSPVTGAELPGGWYLVVENHRLKNSYVRDSVLGRLSAGCEVVTCTVEEHVMCSEATGWNDGVKQWSVIHQAEKSERDLRTEGELPAVFNSIRDRLAAEPDEDVDHMFEVPVELAESFTGYRHDTDLAEPADDAFEVFISRNPSRVIFRIVAGVLVVFGRLMKPLAYFGQLTRSGPVDSETGKPRKSGWNAVLAVLCLASWVVIPFALFRVVWFFHVKMYPTHELGEFWSRDISTRSFIPSFLMVFAPVPGAIALGFLLSYLLVWLVAPSVRRSFQAASPERPGAMFWRAMGGLFTFCAWTLGGGLLVAFVAASVLKSLR